MYFVPWFLVGLFRLYTQSVRWSLTRGKHLDNTCHVSK